MSETAAELPSGSRLRYRLRRDVTRGAQLGCFVVVFLVLGAIAALVLRSAWPKSAGEEGFWLLWLTGGTLALAAAGMLFATIRDALALATPVTVVEIDDAAMTPGRTVSLFVSQPGRGRYESITVALDGRESERGVDRWHLEQTWNVPVFDTGPFEVDGTVPYERTFTFDVPPDLVPSVRDRTRRVEWKVEVSGRLRGRADFRHSYDVLVRAADPH